VICMQRKQHSRTAAVTLAAGLPIIAVALLAGCSSGPASSSSAASGVAGPAGAPEKAAAGSAASAPNAVHGAAGVPNGPVSGGSAGGASAGSGSAQSTSAQRIARTGVELVYTAQLTVRASDVETAVTRATALADGVGGYTSSENNSTDSAHPDQSAATLQLKIPVAVYPGTLARLASGSLGTQLSLQLQAQDVTQQVADVSSQATSDEAAIAQLRSLLTHAGSVADLLTVQNQINSEESDLESMLAQQKALDNETAYATVTLTVLGPKQAPAPAKKARPKPPPGLASGLSGGWRAFRLTVDWLLAIVGTVTPFGAAIAVAAFLGYWLRRKYAARPGAGGSGAGG